mmetsp:Transcript_128/g.292  ORF Transcript_128/g.292 Transcript_128/m.292 type:complete len:132 (+) Transcript_128:68-463(+)|eukprot:CAMPEP_0168741104 /NCGR_PEP_ID=MMETSP0724-20121128/12331_1 /TAXON_ID=265536 /ORGANISM="Amphiprora sp., Strain CCMP467" /LENGTH=131 /DNA_ID=CAMNT_0008788577 /DNA_START=39 /DNA_END=434 /DNA_ORIENTATION=-
MTTDEDGSTHNMGDDMGDDDSGGGNGEGKNKKRKERLEQNRISARESRKRKKSMIEELQKTVITLSRENKELNEKNEQLRQQLRDIGAKYPNVVPLQAIVEQATQSTVVLDDSAQSGFSDGQENASDAKSD